MILPLAMPHQKLNFPFDKTVLAADIGATKSNLAYFKFSKNTFSIAKEKEYRSRDFSNIEQLLNEFTNDVDQPRSVCLAVAGPVFNGKAYLTNLQWNIDSKKISSYFGLNDVHVINDLESTAYGLGLLSRKELQQIHKGSNRAIGNAAIIAPGTGLREAGLYWDGKEFQPFATEGGHSDFAPRNKFDYDLFTFLRRKFGHVSWERIISGPGIVNIYQFLRDKKNRKEPSWLKEKFKNNDVAATISNHVNESLICKETIELFIRYMAYESANLVLKLKATGGLFIGGGITPKLTSTFDNNVFYSSFCQSGRLNFLLEQVPVNIILNSRCALLGAAYFTQCNKQ